MAQTHHPLTRGYSVAYGGEAADFRVFVMALTGVGLFGLSYGGYGLPAFVLGAAAFLVAIYFFPLYEKSQPRLSANDLGICIDGLGIVPWAKIKNLELYASAVRTMINREMVIELHEPVAASLSQTWRGKSLFRSMMYQCWKVGPENVIRVDLEPFAQKPTKVFEAVQSKRPTAH